MVGLPWIVWSWSLSADPAHGCGFAYCFCSALVVALVFGPVPWWSVAFDGALSLLLAGGAACWVVVEFAAVEAGPGHGSWMVRVSSGCSMRCSGFV